MERGKSRVAATSDRELRRKEQLRAAQERLRGRKNQNLASANSRVAELEALMTRTTSTLRLCTATCDAATRFLLDTALSDIEQLSVKSTLPDRTTEQNVDFANLDTTQSDEFTSSSTPAISSGDYFASEMSQNDVGSGSLDLAFAFDDIGSLTSSAQHGSNTDVEQLISSATEQPNTFLYRPSLAADTQTPSYDNRRESVPRNLQMQSLAHHETTFSRHIWRRAMETGYNMLSSSDTHPAWIERVFGNKFAYRTRTFVMNACVQALNEGQYEPIEFFNYPDFQQAQRSQHNERDLPFAEKSPLENDPFSSRAEQRNVVSGYESSQSLMTSRDIEKFCLKQGFIQKPGQASRALEMNVNSWTKPVSHSNKLWILDVERFISHLMTVCVSIDIQPSFPTSEILRMLLSSMKRVMPNVI
ncbi:MAG: hypothetical protein M1828_005846 [Chrysothrix sp. TS-e1954]|nr:MAG: hypothetical protein M1828_005846 [Chrysothrix sp. TS-e1954]